MRKILLVFAVCVCSAVFAENIVLDLSNPGDFPIEYDETGLWADVFNNDAIVYSQEFMFSHASPYPDYSNGFFASKVTAISASAGIDEQGTETGTVEYYLADYRSENADDWKLNDTWEWVDLSELGQIASIYFTMESSDTGDYGINTPTYFCLDKLTVSTEPSSVEESVVAQAKVYYDRSNGTVRVESAQLVEAAVYNMSGTLVMKQLVEGSGAIDMSAYPAGVYVVRCGGYSTKIVK